MLYCFYLDRNGNPLNYTSRRGKPRMRHALKKGDVIGIFSPIFMSKFEKKVTGGEEIQSDT